MPHYIGPALFIGQFSLFSCEYLAIMIAKSSKVSDRFVFAHLKEKYFRYFHKISSPARRLLNIIHPVHLCVSMSMSDRFLSNYLNYSILLKLTRVRFKLVS